MSIPCEAPSPPRLYPADMVALTTYAGGGLAGGLLLFFNSRRLGKGNGLFGLAFGLMLTGLTLGTADLLPDEVPGHQLALLPAGLMWLYARVFQGRAIRRSFADGGRRGSLRMALGAVLLSWVLWQRGPFGYEWGIFPSHCRLDNYEVVYRGGVQRREARALARALNSEFGKGKAMTVYLCRVKGTLHLGMTAKEGAWESDMTRFSYRFVADNLRREAFPGQPLVVDMMNARGEVKKSMPLEPPRIRDGEPGSVR